MSSLTKSILLFIGGIITGIILTFLFPFILSRFNSDSVDDIVLFDKPQQEIKIKQFIIFSIFPNGNALAGSEYEDVVVLFLKDESSPYYDSQEIVVPPEKKLM